MNHAYYTLCLAGCPLTLWIGDLVQAQAYLDMTVNSAANDRWKGCWAFMLRLRNGGAREQLLASFLEPRLDLSTAANIVLMASLPVIPVPQPDEAVGEAEWNLPEILRVNAELLLWHGGPDASPAAESRSASLARRGAAAINPGMGTALRHQPGAAMAPRRARGRSTRLARGHQRPVHRRLWHQ